MPLMLHGLLRVFPGCDAHACCAAWATPGFSGAPPSGPRSHPRRTCPAALRCAGLDRFASAKQRAFGSVHCPAASAPLAPHSVRGAFGQKNPPRTAEKQRLHVRTSIGSMPVLLLVWVACASPRKAEGFFGLPSRTRSCARGVEVAGVKNAAESAFFRACKGDSSSEARSVDEGASPSPDTGTPEKPVVARAAKQARASHRD